MKKVAVSNSVAIAQVRRAGGGAGGGGASARDVELQYEIHPHHPTVVLRAVGGSP